MPATESVFRKNNIDANHSITGNQAITSHIKSSLMRFSETIDGRALCTASIIAAYYGCQNAILDAAATAIQKQPKLLNSLKGYAKRRLETCSSKVSIWKNEMATALDEVEKYDNQIKEIQNEKEDF